MESFVYADQGRVGPRLYCHNNLTMLTGYQAERKQNSSLSRSDEICFLPALSRNFEDTGALNQPSRIYQRRPDRCGCGVIKVRPPGSSAYAAQPPNTVDTISAQSPYRATQQPGRERQPSSPPRAVPVLLFLRPGQRHARDMRHGLGRPHGGGCAGGGCPHHALAAPRADCRALSP